jgi:hypothetical protein
MNTEQLDDLKYHIQEALRYLENAPDSPFPGFDCALCELIIADEIANNSASNLLEEDEQQWW